MSETYKLSWEAVSLSELWRYSDADPALYSNTKQIVPNSEIPEEHWHPVSRETDNPWDQYQVLKNWDNLGKGFVRKVKLEQMVTEPSWKPVDTSQL